MIGTSPRAPRIQRIDGADQIVVEVDQILARDRPHLERGRAVPPRPDFCRADPTRLKGKCELLKTAQPRVPGWPYHWRNRSRSLAEAKSRGVWSKGYRFGQRGRRALREPVGGECPYDRTKLDAIAAGAGRGDEVRLVLERPDKGTAIGALGI